MLRDVRRVGSPYRCPPWRCLKARRRRQSRSTKEEGDVPVDLTLDDTGSLLAAIQEGVGRDRLIDVVFREGEDGPHATTAASIRAGFGRVQAAQNPWTTDQRPMTSPYALCRGLFVLADSRHDL